MTFRREYRNDLPMRAFDILLHIIAAWATHSFWQWAPDIMLVVMWPWSMITNRFMPGDSVIVIVHRVLHNILTVCMLGVVCVWWHPLQIVAINWALHFAIDSYTHRGWEA